MKEGFTVKINDSLNLRELAARLADLGYKGVGTSTPGKDGEFSTRGGLVDLWLERYKVPVRVDLIGEKIENLYLFNPLTQAKIKNLKQVYVVPFGVTPKLAPKWAGKAKFPAGAGGYERLFLSEIEPGDLVVHIDHGIGKFIGVEPQKLKEAQINSDQVFVVEYARGDKLYVPVGQIERLTKYIGAAGFKPRLNSLGTSSWERVKAKVQESIVKIAQDLLGLYANRELARRSACSPDTVWQRQLEESFEFEETQDQIKAVGEIKEDLENTKPMDRILVGDVGFGKTEVAIRAAFKVVQEGKQVAVLVPTTLLAQQHYYLFKERLRSFPVKVEMLSRFKKPDEQEAILEKLKMGNIDIVIGTHRLLSSDVSFRDLGLLIVDEEHRFGVAHKEKLKSLRTSVDILSMSATPIPRTLHMALTHLRDISVLKEPPAGRRPIRTFVGEFDEDLIKKEVYTELSRGGQVYYLFNSVAYIAKKAAQVSTLVPRAKVAFAHGQMREAQLEEAMSEFYSGKADILVCTTIIGSGLDMPNVNTIIIEDVQKFGLAEIHQLRGRVGRSEKEAYAYLFYPKMYVPVGNVLERLLAVVGASQPGAGFQLAKKDLEIRGAGNLLGTAQHGNIALVGFELYIQLLSQQIEKLKKLKAPS
jgi:transcription-repair coupling factor (superfamily II helicase)